MKLLFSLIVIFLLSFSFALSAECNNGYEWQRMSGVGCVQTDCESIANAHYSYTKSCVCGSSGSINENPEDANIECHRDLDFESCPGCVYACVHKGENCPDDLTPQVGLPEKYQVENHEVWNSDDKEYEESGKAVPIDNEEELKRLTKEYIVQGEAKSWPRELEYNLEDLDENGCSPAEKVVYEQHKETKEIFTYCSCKPGFKRTESGACIFDKPDILLNDMDLRNLEDTLLELKPGDSTVFETKWDFKNPIKIGIVRRNDYELAFTVDGKKWNKNLQELINPSAWQKTKKTWNSAWSALNPVNWFGHTAYKDEDKELKWQIADATLKRYNEDISKPKHYMYDVEYWYKYAQDKNLAARTLRDSGLIDGSIDLTKGYVWGDLKGHLYAFPAESVKKLQSELKTDDFAQAFSIYANYRKDKSPEELASNPSEDLDLAISIGTASSLGEFMLFQKYEEAYQRYLVAKSLK